MPRGAWRTWALAIGALGVTTAVTFPATSSAQEPLCPAGMYWDVYTAQCLYYDVDVYLNPAPIVGPFGPVGVGGVIGPVGPGPVGPGPVGPGPVGPRGPGIGRR